MNDRSKLLMLGAAVLATGCTNEGADEAATGRLEYPPTRIVEHTDVYHGVTVADPYRWLEEDVRESEAVREWVEAQSRFTFDYLAKIPEREAIRSRLTALWDYERFDVPFRAGDRYLYRRNDGLQNQYVLYALETLEGEPTVLIDPNAWSDDGTVALAAAVPSHDGRYLAYTIQDGGSDWRTARVLDLETGELLPETLRWLKFTGISWNGDGTGFYYGRFPEPEEGAEFQGLNLNQSVWFHRVGTPQSEDRQVYARPDRPDWGFDAVASRDGRHLVIHIGVGTDFRNRVAYLDLTNPDAEPVMLVDDFEAGYAFLGNRGNTLYFMTNREAPKGRVVGIDLDRRESGFREVIPEDEHVLSSVALIGGRFVAEYLADAKSRVLVFDLDGRRDHELALPGIGSAYGFSGEPDDPEMFFGFTSYNNPGEIWRYDVVTGEKALFRRAEAAFDPDDYEVGQVFYTSKDGTRVPMFVVHRKGIELDGANPTLLYGYGGFNISLTPSFSIAVMGWLEMGGVYAVANLRGGGEYGEEWHKAGTKLEKQNVFDDFIAAAEYLVEAGYTRPDRLAIFGGSNGGLLVGAVTNQRPDLFGAAIPSVGVMDMLRFHRFTAGRYWTDDYGSSENEAEFRALYAYSPYHNIVDGACYPPVMATTADTDDRVVPAHSFKYIARLQAAQGCANPVLIRIETRAGHGAGKPTAKIIEEYADRWAFLVEHLDFEVPESFGT
ncbi:MAG TPA: prolyl oligopeptidase family serine peptidase [Woeseiaceae bacterium]|nr:prolyl oligopeptidase family serine peptidase [Woeseiaceae bacterium]